MPPNEGMDAVDVKYLVIEKDFEDDGDEKGAKDDSAVKEYQPTGPFGFMTPIKWSNVIHITAYNLIALYGFLTYSIMEHKLLTIWSVFVWSIGAFGLGAGVHRLWTHRCYKAKLPLRIFLLIGYLIAGQNPIYDWVRDHRIHHKYSDTDADPHNTQRGFFFSHVGWLMMKKHPEVIRRGRQVDMSDVLADPVVRFSQKYFSFLKLMVCFVIPSVVPVLCWNEDWYHAIMSQVFMRYVICLHFPWSVNSFAHFYGYRSYNDTIRPVENKLVSLVSMGEGFHNYHHTFPWDYKASELGGYDLFNPSTRWIEFFAKIGWAYDLKRASDNLVKTVTLNKGDGSHPVWGKNGTGKTAKINTE